MPCNLTRNRSGPRRFDAPVGSVVAVDVESQGTAQIVAGTYGYPEIEPVPLPCRFSVKHGWHPLVLTVHDDVSPSRVNVYEICDESGDRNFLTYLLYQASSQVFVVLWIRGT